MVYPLAVLFGMDVGYTVSLKGKALEKVQDFPFSAEGGADHLAFWGDGYLKGTFFSA